MTTKYKILMVGLIMGLVYSSVLWAEQRPREGELRGSFVRLAEREVEGKEYLAIVIRPMEGEEPVTLLLPRRREELGAFARDIRPGQTVEIGYVVEEGQKWVRRIETERRSGPEERERMVLVLRSDIERRRVSEEIDKTRSRLAELREAAERAEREGQHDRAAELREQARRIAEEIEVHARKAQGERPAEAEERLERLRNMAREAEERGEMEKARQLQAEVEGLERAMRRDFERREMEERRREGEWRPEPWWDVRPDRPEYVRERREPRGLWMHLEHMEKELKEVLAVHLERMVDEFRELQMRVERMERELNGLRAENEQLKRELHEIHELRREPKSEVRERRERKETEESSLRRERRER